MSVNRGCIRHRIHCGGDGVGLSEGRGCESSVTARDNCINPEFNLEDIMVRPLPIGVQDFKEVRDEGYLYVDKTDIIHQILSQKSEVY